MLAQNTNDRKCSQYNKNVVVVLDSKQNDDIIIRETSRTIQTG